ncbi:hypothetical protein BCR36DRAFT_581829 [Piromyces finnis]|uniref:DUF4832 domain-containing protein n=1 Tax=Piromyces finnis TaxID=1754191 RepID=A0A1Y1VFD6_9FUNG|nr:hypothetical protein BCR36DRAFT_581829 [Piromyces finnis]|eukprot:ORX54193.1 hypothetical protein BCR36DRAFT_581829 [Piromyces finnis]
MGDILVSKSTESLWTPSDSTFCMSIFEDDLSLINDASVRKNPTIKVKMYTCNGSNLYQHWKMNTISTNYPAVTTNTKVSTTTVTPSSTQSARYTPLSMNESDKPLDNPYRGWFRGAVTVDLNDYPELDCNYINRFHSVRNYRNGLQYLGVRLAEFKDRKISKKALAALDNLLNEYKKRKETVDPTTQIILRFYYDGANNCKTKPNSFDPVISFIDDDNDSDTDSYSKFSQMDDGYLYVNHEDLEYLQDRYNPNILYSNESSKSSIKAKSNTQDNEATDNETENTQVIGYLNDENDLVVLNLNNGMGNTKQIQLSEEMQQKLSYKRKHFGKRFHNKNYKNGIKGKELEDYLEHSVFINDKLNKTKLFENNKKLGRADDSEEYIIKNATISDLNKSYINVAKELQEVGYYQCLEYSPDDPKKCIRSKKVNTYCIYQVSTYTGCEIYSTYDMEPENVNTILIHITQLSDIVNKYKDLVYIYQGSFVGTYGEMHHSNYLDIDNLTRIMDTIEKTFDPSIFLSVRTPRFYRGIKNSFNVMPGVNYTSIINRMGLYNDGMFYSESDYGTYGNSDISVNNGFVSAYRSQEVQFQNTICLNVPNGGEGVFNRNVNDAYTNVSDISKINSLLTSPETYINFYVSEAHARNIHLSYLNDEYDKGLFDHWNKTLAKNIIGTSWNVNGADYIANHLGYRYVIRSSKLLSTNVLDIVIENVGYAPAYVSFNTKVSLVSTSPSQNIEININSDNKKWGFIKQGNEYIKTVTLSINLTNYYSNFKSNSYNVYFNVHDPRTDVDIQLGNTNTYYDGLGYRVGILTIS